MEKLMSTEIAELVKALVRFQSQMKPIEKNKEVKGSFKYSYADLPTIMETITKPLTDNGLALTQCFNGDTLVTTLWHTSGQWIASSMNCSGENHKMQEEGSEITYRRRYSVSALLGLSSEEDDDGAIANQREPYHKPLAAKAVAITSAQDANAERLDNLKKIVERDKMPSQHVAECISIIAERKKEIPQAILASVFSRPDGVEAFKKEYKRMLEDKEGLAV